MDIKIYFLERFKICFWNYEGGGILGSGKVDFRVYFLFNVVYI